MKGDIFANGWNIPEPSHDLSMSSWALTSFLAEVDGKTGKSSVGTKVPQGKGEDMKADLPQSEGDLSGEDD